MTRALLAGAATAGLASLVLLWHLRRRRSRLLFEAPEERVVKRILFCRHGQGRHNLKDEHGSTTAANLQILDPELTDQGVSEARAIFAHAPPGRSDFRPECVLVSPLWRTLQTATEAVAARSDGHTCPMVAWEVAREHNNLNACNHRRPIQPEHHVAFPTVDFSHVHTTGPPPGCEWTPPYKLSFGVLRRRAARALALLDARPEQRIAVVCHATFMRALLSEVMGLDAHHSAKAPHTGQAIEVLRIETPSGGRYWELVSSLKHGGHEVLRLALRDDDDGPQPQQRDDGAASLNA